MDIESNKVQDETKNSKGVGETFFVPKDVMDLQKILDMNPHALEFYKEGTWARSFFPEAEKAMLISSEKASKTIMKDKPDNPSVKRICVKEFPSNSKALKMKKDPSIPGLFTKKYKLSKPSKKATKLKEMDWLTQVIYRLPNIIIQGMESIREVENNVNGNQFCRFSLVYKFLSENLFKMVKTGSNLFKLIQSGFNLIQLVKLVQINLNSNSNWLTLI